jgi:hypothetical protein
MTADDDRELRERFAALRREDEAGAPALERLLARARPRAGTGKEALRLGRPALALAAAAAVFLGIALLDPRKPPPSLPSITEWRSPTDFLLQTPGREVLESLPRFGEGLIPPEPNERRTSS